MGFLSWHGGVSVGKRKTIKLGPFIRLSIGWRKHFGRSQHRRRR
jgi:hypothetical protein